MNKLLHKARGKKAIRCGLTNDPQRRKNEYSRDGYNGTMYFARTNNMKRDEQKLLNVKDWRDNIQKRSNGQEKSGYVYIIVK